MKPLAYLLAIAIALLAVLPAGAAPGAGPTDLSPIQNPPLQGSLNSVIEQAGLETLIQQRRLAVALVVLDSDGGYRLAMRNGDNMVYAASLPKIAVLFAAMVASQEGDLTIEGELEVDLHDMIRVSCNHCATSVMEQVGRERILQILRRPEYHFYDDDLAGGLWVGKDYAGALAYQRDPIKGLSHGATAYQVARMYYRLYRGSLLDAKHTQMMSDMLADPALSHKFVKGLEGKEITALWRKSGTWRNFHADSVLVQSTAGNYILVGLAEGASGEQQLQALATAVHELVESL